VTGDHDIHVHGPNGFFRRFTGRAGAPEAMVSVRRTGRSGALRIDVDALRGTTVTIVDAYSGPVRVSRAGKATLDIRDSAWWYDLTVSVPGTAWLRTFAGHLESGRPSYSDPALSRP
jgi:phospholipase C